MTGKEQETTAVQDVKPTSEQKVEKQTTQKVEPTYTQKQYDEGVGKGSASINRQLSVSKAETKAAQAEVARYKADGDSYQERMQALTKEVEDALVDDPEKRKAYISNIASLEREQKLAKREAETEATRLANERSVTEVFMNRKIDTMVTETGVAREDLMDCQNEAEVEAKALRFQIANPKESGKEEGTPEFDTTTSSGSGGVDLSKLSARELLVLGEKKK